MLNNPITYVCIVFFVMMSACTPSYAATLEPDGVYCSVDSRREHGSPGFLGFLKDTLSCKVNVEYDIEYKGYEFDGDAEVSLSYDEGKNVVEKLRGWFADDDAEG